MEIIWTEEALKRVSNAPDFVRPGILKLMPLRARERGLKTITSEFLTEIRNESMLLAARRMKNMGFEELQMGAFDQAREKMKGARRQEVLDLMESLLKSREKSNAPILDKFQNYFKDLPSGSEGRLIWTKSAEERLQKAPPFVRDMARQAIEDFAETKGVREITPELIEVAMENIVPKGFRPPKGD